MNALPAILWGLGCAGLGAFAMWAGMVRALVHAQEDADVLADALVDEVITHAQVQR